MLSRANHPREPPYVAISACLLGAAVRYDGRTKLSVHCEAMGTRVRWVTYCPEVELGLGVPREPIELERHAGGIRLMSQTTRRDLTVAMQDLVRKRAALLLAHPIAGCITKARSPSCALGTAPVVDARAHTPAAVGASAGAPLCEPTERAHGMLVAALLELCPELPIIDEEQLAREERAAAFAEAVQARWAQCLA
jgi:uncharacterized protein YbbK (DUF523 family)